MTESGGKVKDKLRPNIVKLLAGHYTRCTRDVMSGACAIRPEATPWHPRWQLRWFCSTESVIYATPRWGS